MKARRAMAASAAAVAVLLASAPAAWSRADTTPPTAPSNLRALSVSDVDIVLAWNASTDNSRSVSYAVFFDDNPAPFLTSGSTRFDVRLNRAIGMIPGSRHTFRVRAQDAAGNTAFSDPLTVSFAPGDNTPPTAPGNLRVVSRTASGVALAWDPSSDASSLDYHVAGTPCSPLVVSGAVAHVLVPSVSADPVCGLLPGATYRFAVWARDAFDNDSSLSNPLTVVF